MMNIKKTTLILSASLISSIANQAVASSGNPFQADKLKHAYNSGKSNNNTKGDAKKQTKNVESTCGLEHMKKNNGKCGNNS
jgi:uncharacterized low-complexity protein